MRSIFRPASGHDATDRGQMFAGDVRAEESDEESTLALIFHPLLIFFGRYCSEADLYTDFVSAQQQLGHDGTRSHIVRQFDENAEGKRVMDDGLSNIKDAGVELRQHACEGMSDTRSCRGR